VDYVFKNMKGIFFFPAATIFHLSCIPLEKFGKIKKNGGIDLQYKKKKKEYGMANAQAPGIDPDDSYGKRANKEEVKEGESTRVTRFVYDEYERSEG
jgi:hypothetical protein